MSKLRLTILFLIGSIYLFAQRIPTEDSNIDYIVTYSEDAHQAYGDDDHVQIFFITVPMSYREKFYLRIYSPGANSSIDVKNGDYNSVFEYKIYGGDSVLNEAAKHHNPIAGYNKGVLLDEEIFGPNADTTWVSMGPFNPKDGGVFITPSGGKQRIFKLICKGLRGNDGNLYRLYVSALRDQNIAITGGNSFTYEYSFRMATGKEEECYVFPFIDNYTKAIKQYNFDYDGDGSIRLYTIEKKGLLLSTSGDGEWAENTIYISQNERNKTGEIMFKNKGNWHNDVTFYLLNQYDESMPFYTIPIGNRPVKSNKIIINHK
ncbi:MAG: hypothetical protein N4A35_08160 [Flavobacteriales bacterium]|jgi:hypothetical protein|nr:hypothetical protein [Flavobacteriales bacterium]